MYPWILQYNIFLFVIIFFKFFSFGQNLVAVFSDIPVDRPLTPVDRLCLRRKNFVFFLCYRSTVVIGPVDRSECVTLCIFSVDRSLNPSRPIVVFWLIFGLFLHCFSHSLLSLSANRRSTSSQNFPTSNPSIRS